MPARSASSSSGPGPRSRRDRPAKPALSHAAIVGAAVRLMRAEGLQRVTMRRLAQELDTGPASLYVYLANTSELHAAILEELLGEVALHPAEERAGGGAAADRGAATGADAGDWRDRLVAVLDSYTQVLFTHPSLARAALVARPSGPNYLALVERILALLHQGGVPDAQAAWGVDLLLQVATATAAEQSTRDDLPEAAADHASLAAALHEIDPATHPRIAATATTLTAGTPAQRLAWTFQAVIAGTASTPLPADTA